MTHSFQAVLAAAKNARIIWSVSSANVCCECVKVYIRRIIGTMRL